LNTLKNSKNNRYKQYLLADSGYHSQNNINYLKKIGYTPIIAYNKRNCKSRKTIEKNKLRGKEAKIYKKRLRIESFFSWIKNFPVINQNYQKTITSYEGLLSLASSMMISKRV
jgi:transposase